MAALHHQVATALGLMNETQATLAGYLPDTVPNETAAILQSTLLADCTGMHIGIEMCLRASVLTPALSLCRNLVSNAMMLSYMEANASIADELALRFSWPQLNREIRLVEEQQRVHGVDRSQVLRGLQDERQALKAEADTLGLDITKSLPSTADMAAMVGIDKMRMKHGLDILSQSVHSGRSSLRRRIAPTSGDSLGAFTPRESDPVRIVECAALANAAETDVARSVSTLQMWDDADEVARFGNDVTARFNGLQLEMGSSG